MQRSLIALAALVVGCSNEPAAPRAHLDQLNGALAAKRAPNDASAAVVIDDVLERLIPSLDAELAAELKGPLTAIKAALKTKDLAALAGATAVATRRSGHRSRRTTNTLRIWPRSSSR